jgi:hypothetical protein
LRFFILFMLVLMCQIASAETVQVKDHGTVSLDSFVCTAVEEDSDLSRICYDKFQGYLLIRIKTTYYHYCRVGSALVLDLQTAILKQQFFESRIRGSGTDRWNDCGGDNPVPKKYRR